MTKEMGFIILNPTKFVWDFSDFSVNFYAFYKSLDLTARKDR
jgi:hypothetical protein